MDNQRHWIRYDTIKLIIAIILLILLIVLLLQGGLPNTAAARDQTVATYSNRVYTYRTAGIIANGGIDGNCA